MMCDSCKEILRETGRVTQIRVFTTDKQVTEIQCPECHIYVYVEVKHGKEKGKDRV
jgi:RNase P subunit RPR2